MTKITKTTQTTKKKTDQAKNGKRWSGEYYDPKIRTYRPYTEDQLIDLLREYGDRSDVLHLEDFYDDLHMSPHIYSDLLKKIPKLKEVHEYAKRRIGIRREKGALNRKLDASTVHKTLGHYWSVFKEMEEWRAHLRAKTEEANKSRETVVVIEKVPTSDKVPE